MKHNSNGAVRLTAWSAIFGGIFAYLNLVFAVMVVGDDVDMTLHGASMLTLSTDARDLMRLSMLSDILGFYLPVLIIGAYLWHRFRDESGALGDMAVLAILVYVVIGISGAAIQTAAIHPLARLHAGGDDTVKAASEAAWTAVSYGCQKGLWWAEGPLVLFWGLNTGPHLKRAGWGRWSLLPLTIVGWCFGLFFVFTFVTGLNDLAEMFGTVAVLLLPFWMMLFGWKLLRQPTSAPATA
jgi:hypothetical protein